MTCLLDIRPRPTPPSQHVVLMEPLEYRPIGTNGYVSTWGALTSLCPPQGR